MAPIPKRALVLVLVGAVAVALGAFLLTGSPDGESDQAAPDTAGGSEALETGDDSIEPLPLPAGDPLIGSPVPESGSAAGELVEGFPEEALPLAPGSDLTSSSIAVEGSRVQAGLVATSTSTAADLLNFYRAAYAELELSERDTAALPGSTSVVFTRDADAITLTVTERDGAVDYTLLGIFTAA